MPCVESEIMYHTPKKKFKRRKIVTQKERFDMIENVIAMLEQDGFQVWTSDPEEMAFTVPTVWTTHVWEEQEAGLVFTGRWKAVEKPFMDTRKIIMPCILIEAVLPGTTQALRCPHCRESRTVGFPDCCPSNFKEFREEFLEAHRFCAGQVQRKAREEVF